MPLADCQYCTHRCHCSPGRKIIRPYPIDQQDKLFLDPDVDVKTEKLLEKSEDVATEIRGCLNTAMHNEVPNLSETKVVLKDLLNLSENKVTIDLIQTVVCKFFKISKNEMLSSRRSRYLVRPRQTAIYLTKILTSKSLPEIGREFSNRDHTTIIHSVKTIEKIKEKDPEMVDNINKLKNQILYNNKDNEI